MVLFGAPHDRLERPTCVRGVEPSLSRVPGMPDPLILVLFLCCRPYPSHFYILLHAHSWVHIIWHLLRVLVLFISPTIPSVGFQSSLSITSFFFGLGCDVLLPEGCTTVSNPRFHSKSIKTEYSTPNFDCYTLQSPESSLLKKEVDWRSISCSFK